jgi:hypothetical protein
MLRRSLGSTFRVLVIILVASIGFPRSSFAAEIAQSPREEGKTAPVSVELHFAQLAGSVALDGFSGVTRPVDTNEVPVCGLEGNLGGRVRPQYFPV